MDVKRANDIINTSGKVKKLAPHVVHAAKILFKDPDNEVAKEHYEQIKEDYQNEALKLQKLVDGAVDPVEFVVASEEQIKREVEEAKAAIKSGDNPQESFNHVSNAARLANRVAALAKFKAEVENTKDPKYNKGLETVAANVTQSIFHVVTTAKNAIQQAGTEVAIAQFSQEADKLSKNIHEVYTILNNQHNPSFPEKLPSLPPPANEDVAPNQPPPPQEVDKMKQEATLQAANPIGFAAHHLHQEAKQWEEKDNDMVAAAKRMARLMMQMSKFAKDEQSKVTYKAQLIAKESEEVVKMARNVADACTDKSIKRTLLQVIDAIPTIATQLKIIAAVKATRQGGDDPEADKEATEMLTDNAQNLMKAVSEVLYATEAATIRISSRGSC